ncbi:hypothetical protein QFZ60_001732 [Arthrobacter sp. B2I5]|uniref:hypothetical protein n=1 Tax=Arthrobacter sp. B2I5 TaxID=3042266 RepID=UPI00277D61C5|nr:hypothetical protein [Arthrobacter sp. B2I5]MDQ0825559.1 hypothetical protein [Arthrobacter sp. B2I5]
MTDSPDRPKQLSVGVIVGGFTPESRIWREALMRLSRDVSGVRDQLSSDLNLTVEFHVPGHLIAPDFQGVRTGTFRKADRLLKVQVGVPVDPPDNPYAYGAQAMRAAVDAAKAWSGRKQVEFDPEPFSSLLALLETKSRQGFQDSQRMVSSEIVDAGPEDEERSGGPRSPLDSGHEEVGR